MKHHHIPLKKVQGSITWHGNTPPTEKQLKFLNEMAERAVELNDNSHKTKLPATGTGRNDN